MRKNLTIAAILLFALLAYLPTIHFALVYDDQDQIVANRRLTAWSFVPGYFTTQLWAHEPWASPIYFRPIFLLWLRFVYATLGPPGDLWHWSSIVAHLLATACVLLLILRLTGNFGGAALAAALFAIHPIQTEAVAWVSSSGDLILTSLVVLSVYLYARRKGSVSWLSIVFATLAMFTKEAGIVVVALIFAYEWIQSDWKKAAVATSPYGLPVPLYLAVRANALGGLIGPAYPMMSVGAMVLTWPRILAAYGLHFIWPVHLSVIYDVAASVTILPLLLLIAVVASVGWLVRGSCANVRFGVAWFAIALAPALAIRYITPSDFIHDRYLYLPSVGLALLAATWFSRIRVTRVGWVVLCILALALGWQTRANLRIWQNDITLFTRALETAPSNLSAKNNLAYAYLNAHRPQDAFPLLQELIQIEPGAMNVNYNMGRYYQQVGNSDAANYYFSIAEQFYRH